MAEATGRTARPTIEQALNKIAILRTSDVPCAIQAAVHTTEIAFLIRPLRPSSNDAHREFAAIALRGRFA